jgi:preprotein translocase subunit SecA
MNSENIFDYSNEFLKEISDDLIKLKISNLSNPKSNEFYNKTKQIIGKSFEETEFKDLIEAKDKDFKEKISNKFQETRNDRIKLLGEDYAKEIEKRIFLQSIDLNWKSHIQYLEQLRQVIGLRSYGQRDPLVEYKKEAFELFSNLLEKLKLDYLTILMNLKVVTETNQNGEINREDKYKEIAKNKKIGRNEPCHCGSGKKFKHCCGAL